MCEQYKIYKLRGKSIFLRELVPIAILLASRFTRGKIQPKSQALTQYRQME
jgi:hypothetical protein